MEEARVAARQYLSKRFADDSGVSSYTHDDWVIEFTYQCLYRFVYQWDPNEKIVGERFFETMDQAREIVEFREANRVMSLYNKYVEDEHPEVVLADTFRSPESRSEGVVPGAPR